MICCGRGHDHDSDNFNTIIGGNPAYCNCDCETCEPYRRKVLRVGETHSYEKGLNGRFGEYRIARLSEAIKLLPRTDNVLEIGCGEGRITEFLATKFSSVVAIEPSRRAWAVTHEKGLDIELHNLFFEEYRTSETFDCVVATGVLEHVQDSGKLLSLTKRVMRPESLLILTVPNASSVHRRIGQKLGLIKTLDELGSLDREVGHYRYYDSFSLLSELNSNGLQVVSMRGIFFKPVPFSELEKQSEEYVSALFELGNEFPAEYCAELFVAAKRML